MAPRTEWLEADYYAVLGVPADASCEAIARSYRHLARRWHPDANPDEPAAEERFKQVAAAYEVLGDPAKRAEYDELRRLATASDPSAGLGGWPTTDGSPFRIRVTNVAGAGAFRVGSPTWDDLLAALFATPTRGHPRSRRGADLEANIELDFDDAVCGTTVELPSTNGVPGCPLTLDVPAGVSDGERIRVARHGRPGTGGRPPGDLYVRVRVRPHPLFGRRGHDLTIEVPIGLDEAALGTTVRVPVLGGKAMTVQVAPGSQPGQVLRLKGKGVPARSGRPSGDLLVTLRVVVPQHLSEEQRRAFEALADVCPTPSRDHLEV